MRLALGVDRHEEEVVAADGRLHAGDRLDAGLASKRALRVAVGGPVVLEEAVHGAVGATPPSHGRHRQATDIPTSTTTATHERHRRRRSRRTSSPVKSTRVLRPVARHGRHQTPIPPGVRQVTSMRTAGGAALTLRSGRRRPAAGAGWPTAARSRGRRRRCGPRRPARGGARPGRPSSSASSVRHGTPWLSAFFWTLAA